MQIYLRFLAKWNEKVNLTAIQNPLDVVKVLLAESFWAAVLVDDPKGPILDIGSGAGFPGLAMAVYRPELELVLLEPRKKRAAFLAALRREMGLAGVAVWNRRLEDCIPTDFSVLPTVLTMRAVGRIAKVVAAGVRLPSRRSENSSIFQRPVSEINHGCVDGNPLGTYEADSMEQRAPDPSRTGLE